MFFWHKNIYCTIIVCLLYANCFGQTFRYEQFTTHNGLPVDNVYAAAQDAEGKIWFATDFGIAKYDGYRFINFNRANGITSKAITDIMYAGGDSCVFIAYPRDVQSIHKNGTVRHLVTVPVNNSLHQIINYNGHIYFYQRNGSKVFEWKYNTLHQYAIDSIVQSNDVTLHGIYNLGSIGLGYCTNKGLFIIKDAAIKHVLQMQDVYAAIVNASNNIVAVANQAIVESNADFTFTKKGVAIPSKNLIYHMAMDKSNTIWLRSIGKGVYSYKDNVLQEISAKLNVQNKEVHKVFIDKNSNAWFCTDGAGILLKRQNNFVNYSTLDGLISNKVFQIAKTGNTFIIGTNNGISVYDGSVVKPLPLPHISANLQYVYKLYPLANNSFGAYITSTFKEDIAKKDFITNINYQKIGDYNVANLPYQAFLKETDNAFWSCNFNTLTKVENNVQVKKLNLNDNNVKKIYDLIKYDNKLYVASNNGVLIYHNDQLHHIDSLFGKKVGETFQFFLDKKNKLWLATENGLLTYYNNVWQSLPKGETAASNYCKSICIDKEDKIWCATWNGIFIMDGDKRINYTTDNGLSSNTCNVIYYEPTTDEIIVGTDDGLNVIAKSKLMAMEYFPKVNISCTLNDSIQLVTDVVLRSFQNSLSFYLNVPSFVNKGAIMYEYKLDDGEWVATTNPVVYFANIKGGKHKLIAKAKLNGQSITAEDAVFYFEIKKRFYTTWGFWIAVILLGQFFIFRIINKYNKKAREKKLAIQQQELELNALKQQAFTSLMNPHFIFNALNSVQHYINKQDRQAANKYLSDFAMLVRKNFDASQKAFILLEDELETIRLYLELEKMRFVNKFTYTITLSKAVEDDEWMLPGMVLQPFLENAVLHGIAPLVGNGAINIAINAANNILYITITDNGIGIEKSKELRQNKKHNSKGMQLIKERLEVLSKFSTQPITLTITPLQPNEENQGTKIELVIPQEVYEQYTKANSSLVVK